MDLAAKFRLIEKLPKSLGDKLIKTAIINIIKNMQMLKLQDTRI